MFTVVSFRFYCLVIQVEIDDYVGTIGENKKKKKFDAPSAYTNNTASVTPNHQFSDGNDNNYLLFSLVALFAILTGNIAQIILTRRFVYEANENQNGRQDTARKTNRSNILTANMFTVYGHVCGYMRVRWSPLGVLAYEFLCCEPWTMIRPSWFFGRLDSSFLVSSARLFGFYTYS